MKKVHVSNQRIFNIYFALRVAMSRKYAHLEMIQGTINRLSHNSFLLKGWSVILVSAMFAIAAKDAEIIFIFLAYFPAACFWGLDGYFLYQERLFRAHYDYVRTLPKKEIDFSMNTSVVSRNVSSWQKATFSRTLLAFHGTILGSIVIVMLIIMYKS